MKVRVATEGLVLFHCPGCDAFHGVSTNPAHPNKITGGRWSWNGSRTSPTFSPSILVNPHETVRVEIPDGLSSEALTEFLFEHRVMTPRCHSFVRDGKIEFLSDCTHALAGQTVELPDVE